MTLPLQVPSKSHNHLDNPFQEQRDLLCEQIAKLPRFSHRRLILEERLRVLTCEALKAELKGSIQ